VRHVVVRRARRQARPSEQLRPDTPWSWTLHAPGAFAFVPLIIRWGPNALSAMLGRSARCTSCGGMGAVPEHPSRAGSHIGFEPFPLRTLSVADSSRQNEEVGLEAGWVASRAPLPRGPLGPWLSPHPAQSQPGSSQQALGQRAPT
jgi:hypothetical protein